MLPPLESLATVEETIVRDKVNTEHSFLSSYLQNDADISHYLGVQTTEMTLL